MGSSFTLYPSARQYCHDGTIDLANDTIKLILCDSTYTPATSDSVLADINGATSDPELDAGGGYTVGGTALANQAVTHTESPSAGKFDADDHVISALTATFRYGVLYANVTVGAIVNPLIGYILYDTTPADIVVSGVDWTTQWAAVGIITF